MIEIKKKIWREWFDEVASGKKKFEVRLADWEAKEGDILVLQEWDAEKKQFTGREIRAKVGYVLKTKDVKYWSKEDIEKYGFQIIQIEVEN